MTRGLISELDAQTIEATLRLILDVNRDVINITEVGLFNCATAIGICEFLQENGVISIDYTGIDSEKDKPINPPSWMNYIKGSSNEVYYKLKDNSQDLIFIDANHSFASVIADFYCYASKVKENGYFVFHDVGKHIKPMSGYQSGEVDNPDSYVSVRKALQAIGLFSGDSSGRTLDFTYDFYRADVTNWELIYDRADEMDEFGGICVFKKMY